MSFPSYNLRRVVWPFWSWRAQLQDGSVRKGLAFSKASARWAARTCVRNAAVSQGSLAAE